MDVKLIIKRIMSDMQSLADRFRLDPASVELLKIAHEGASVLEPPCCTRQSFLTVPYQPARRLGAKVPSAPFPRECPSPICHGSASTTARVQSVPSALSRCGDTAGSGGVPPSLQALVYVFPYSI
jgi:hypothetical protein